MPTHYGLRVDVPTEYSLATNHTTYHRFDAPTDFRVDANATTHHTLKLDTSKDIASVLKVLAVAVLLLSIGYAYSAFSLVPNNIFGAALFVLGAAALIIWALDQQDSVKEIAARVWNARRGELFRLIVLVIDQVAFSWWAINMCYFFGRPLG